MSGAHYASQKNPSLDDIMGLIATGNIDSILISPQVCQRALRQRQFYAPDGKILRDLDEDLV